MDIALINCSLRHQNTDRTVATLAEAIKNHKEFTANTVTLDSFLDLFTGDFITPDIGTPEQRSVLQTIKDAKVLLFVCPTYYKTMPGGIKNFFDIVRDKQLYENKLILAVSSNHKNQDFGARDLLLAVAAMAEFYDINLTIVPEIPIIDPDHIDMSAVKRVIELLERYTM